VRPRRPKRPSTLWGDFLSLFFYVPLWSIPFALFFGVVYGRNAGDFVDAYVVSLIFAFTINVCIWAAQWFARPWVLPQGGAPSRGRTIRHVALFGGAALVGTAVAALVLQFTLMPGILGSARRVATLVMFTLVFVTLVIGIVFAVRFYRDAIERARSDQELNLARRIQRSFLPSEFPGLKRIEMHAVNVSSRHVSGDFYDVVPEPGDGHLLAIADVAGKGVPAALLCSMLQASLRMQAADGRSVSEMMSRINALVHRSTTPEQFATFVLARIEERSLRLSYSNAGHNVPVVFRADGGRRMLERGGTVVGILETAAYEEESVELAPGDRVVFYTDGISEAENAAREMFGEDRLYETIERLPRDADARAIALSVLDAVRAFLDGVEPGDDMTVMVVRVLEEQKG